MVLWSNALAHTRSGKSALRPRSSRMLPAVALGIAVVVSLSACGGDADSEPTVDPTEPSVSSSPEYVPASADGPAQNVPVPELPDEAHEQTAEGAEAALKHFWETWDYLNLTGDSGPLEDASVEDCAFCQNNIENWTSLYADDHWMAFDGRAEVVDPEVVLTEDNSAAEVRYKLNPPFATTFDPGGNIIDESVTQREDEEWTAILEFNSPQSRWAVFETAYTKYAEAESE